MRVFIGYDSREERAARVALGSLATVTNGEIEGELLRVPKLYAHGLLTRLVDGRGGQAYDLASNAPMSTEFANARFLVPILCQGGPALFVDCDVVFLEDPRRMLAEVGWPQQRCSNEHLPAVWVVKHRYVPTNRFKMVNQRQTTYPRKNWSSVMLFNCDHPANQRLSLRDVNERPGRDLHGFYWLADSEIGALDPRWNWLVGEQPKPKWDQLGIAHFTLGGPWLDGWKGAEHDELWNQAAAAVEQPGVAA